jgi:hypothetical protein
MTKDRSADEQPEAPFAKQAEAPRASFFAELWAFLRSNKKWWLTPVIIVLLMVGVLVILSSTAAAPFIYTLF